MLGLLLLAGPVGAEAGGTPPQRPTPPERPCGALVVGTSPADLARWLQSPRERELAAQRARFEAHRAGTRALVPGGLVESEARRIAEIERQRLASEGAQSAQTAASGCGQRQQDPEASR
jgi:hypothetical protein